MSVVSGIKFRYTHSTNSFCVHHRHPTALDIYLIHTKIRKPYWYITSCRHHCWSTNAHKNGFRWWQIRWFSIWLQSGIHDRATFCYWFCLGLSGITIDTINDDDGKTIMGWRCNYCLIPGNRGGSRFFKHRNACKALSHLTKGKNIVTCTGLQYIPPNVDHALTALKYSKSNRKHDIAVQRNNLHDEVEQQQESVLGARIER